MKTGNSMIY